MELWLPIRKLISENPEIVAILGLVGTTVGITVTLLLYKLARPRKLLAYATRTFCVIPELRFKLQGVEVLYNKSPVQALAVTRVGVWNAGNESLRRSDIPRADPPVIYARDGINVFEATILESSSAANNVTLEPVYSPVAGYAINFEFLDTGDGAVISVVHDGTKVSDVRLGGEIIGGRLRRTVAHGETPETIRDERAFAGPKKPQSGRASLRIAAIALVVLLPILGVIFMASSYWRDGLLMFVLGPTIGGGMFLLSRRVYPPARLRMFDDNLHESRESVRKGKS